MKNDDYVATTIYIDHHALLYIHVLENALQICCLWNILKQFSFMQMNLPIAFPWYLELTYM